MMDFFDPRLIASVAVLAILFASTYLQTVVSIISVVVAATACHAVRLRAIQRAADVRIRHALVESLQTDAAEDALRKILKDPDLSHLLPPYLARPFERCRWLNAVVHSIWPHFSTYLDASLKPLLNDILFAARPESVKRLEVLQITFGRSAPSIGGLLPSPPSPPHPSRDPPPFPKRSLHHP